MKLLQKWLIVLVSFNFTAGIANVAMPLTPNATEKISCFDVPAFSRIDGTADIETLIVPLPDSDVFYLSYCHPLSNMSQEKPILIVNHGFGGGSSDWNNDGFLTDLFDVYLIDIPLSITTTMQNIPVISPFTLDSWADLTVALAASLHEQYPNRPIHFMGHSIGTTVTLLASLRRIDSQSSDPDFIKPSLILVSTMPPQMPENVDDWFFNLFMNLIKDYPNISQISENLIAEQRFVATQSGQIFLNRFIHDPVSSSDIQAYADRLQSPGYAKAAFQVAKSIIYYKWEDLNNRIMFANFNVLNIKGQYDRTINDPFLAEFSAIELGVQQTIIPDAGHYPQLEKPADFEAAVRKFLSKQTDKTSRL